ncbi:unnamed protein product [Malus baccata var. baccata]
MDSSNFGDVPSNSKELNSSFIFNTPPVSRQGSGLSRPRLVKVRRGSAFQVMKPAASQETEFCPGFNPFRTSLGSWNPVSSGAEAGTSASGAFGTTKTGNEAKLFRADRIDPTVNSGKWDTRGGLGKGVIDEMRNLKIGSGNEFLNTKVGGFTFNARRLNSAPGLDKGGFVFGNGNKKNSSIVSKLPKDMRKLNIEGAEKREAVEAGKDQKFNFNANDKTKFGSGSIDNVGGSLGQNVESELPNELKKRLNIKETVQLDRSTDWPSADDVNKFVFGNSKNDSYSLAGTSENVLPAKMNNLNIKDTFDGRKDLAMATERLDINEVDATNREAKEGSFEYRHNGSVDAEGTLEGSMSQVETESFKSTAEELDFNGDNSHTSAETEASSGSYLESHDTDGRIHIAFPSWSDNRSGSNFSFAASSAAQSQVSASKRLQKKKILVKAGQDTNTVVPNVKIPYASSSSQFLPYSGTSAHLSPGHYQKIESSNPQRRHGDNSGVRKEQELKQETTSFSAEAAAAQEAFEKLRLRSELIITLAAGNEAFQGGRHTEAVEHYTTALSCNVESHLFTAVCFCNCAAAYKALGQITDAIADCSLPIALDGNYLKAISRRATLCEMIRDYGQAAKDLQRLVSILTKQAGQLFSKSDNGDDGLWKEIAEEVHKDADKLFKMIGEAYARSRYDTEEEMRNAQKKRGGSSTSGMPADVQSLPI